VAIATLAVWALTAAAGLYLLTSVIAAERAARPRPPLPVRRAPAPVPRTKVSSPSDAHPLLEFCHPALGVTGLACWFAFVGTHDRAFAWIAVTVLVATIGAGLGWLAARGRSARHRADGSSGPAVPAHRVVLHGLAAAATCVLVLVTILAASHG
jgi:hypothetical protein